MVTDKNFEEMMQELEKISQDLEKGDLTLGESVKKFEKGIELSKECSKVLEEAEKKITILIKDGDELKEEKFDINE